MTYMLTECESRMAQEWQNCPPQLKMDAAQKTIVFIEPYGSTLSLLKYG